MDLQILTFYKELLSSQETLTVSPVVEDFCEELLEDGHDLRI